MQLPPGTRLGPYTIVAPLGAGGMGEVYRARDTRLGRDVAIKTLPAAFAEDLDRRARFEAEAGAIAALSHPNVLAIHDIGTESGTIYLVMELVEGQTLRERLEDGPLPTKRAIAFAAQIAHGLAAAHDKGIVHRDLKPENIIVTPEGRARILDFGLARREQPEATASQSLAPTLALMTEPGMVMGTNGYMSPEQVRGQPADARSDLFALGAVLHEMLTGRRAFHAETAADTMSAILREDPPELTRVVPDVPLAVERIVRRCLEKQAAARFRSAADLAFALEAVASESSGARTPEGHVQSSSAVTGPRFRRLTYRNGTVAGARFVPDSTSIVYGASWEGKPFEIFTSQPGNAEARSLGLPKANLLAMSESGEMALSLDYHHDYWNQVIGVLARTALAGGGIRPLQKQVGHAAWSPDSRSMAVVRYVGGRCRLEYPSGTTLCETADWIGRVSVSRDGRHVAFARHPVLGDSGGELVVADSNGSLRVLVPDMTSMTGVEWSPTGEEVWYSGIDEHLQNGVWAVQLDGAKRELVASPTRVALHDVATDGRVLLALGNLRLGMTVVREDGHRAELSWFDGSVAAGLTADGSQLMFWEGHEAENPHYATFLRGVDGSPAVRLGEGSGTDISADGAWVVAILNRPKSGLVLYPTGLGEPRAIVVDGIDRFDWAGFHPDGQQLFLVASSPDRPRRLFLVSRAGGTPRLLWDEPVRFDEIIGPAISSDGDWVVLRRPSGEAVLFSCRDGSSQPFAELALHETALRFDPTGQFVYVAGLRQGIRRIDRIDLQTGARTHWRDVGPSDPTGVVFVGNPVMSADAGTLAFSYYRSITDLYLVEGLR